MARRVAPRRRRIRRSTEGALRPFMWRLLIAVALVLLIGGFIAGRLLAPPEHDKETLCPKTGPEAGLVILLDLTDRIGSTQHVRLREILKNEVANTRQNTLIAVGAVRPQPSGRGVDFEICKPLEGSAANKLYQNPRLVAERYEKGFRQPFATNLEKMLTADGADRSPIMESLQAVLAATPGFLDATYARRVLIISDLLQHSAVFSFYRGDTWRKFQRSRNFARLARTLQGVDVEILRLPRPEAKIDSAEVGNFWANYFDKAGARRVRSRMLGDL